MEPTVGIEWRALTFSEGLRYWKGQLDGVSVIEFPTDRSRPHVTGSRIASQAFDVPREVTARLAAAVSQYEISWLDLTVAAFQVVLARYTGQDDLVVAMPAPGRAHPVLLRSRIADSTSFLDFLLEVRTTAKGAHAHSEVPFDHLVEELHLGAELARVAVGCELA
ncbi:MAG: hypothetical protein QOH66_1806, partial [Actinomycetota bacterium]|nr:hypothetical protein [Actinomycetota bacterium]